MEALRHFAVDRVDKLLKRSFRKNVDHHAVVVEAVGDSADQGLADGGNAISSVTRLLLTVWCQGR